MVLIKILTLAATFCLAIIIISYREKIVRMFGKNELAERYLGNGGSYNFWILFAILIVFIAATWFFF